MYIEAREEPLAPNYCSDSQMSHLKVRILVRIALLPYDVFQYITEIREGA